MDIDSLIQFDRQLLLVINGTPSLFLDAMVKTLTTAATWIPLYLVLFVMVVRNSETLTRVITIVACAGLCVLIAGSVDDMIVKPMVGRWRPTHDPMIGMLVDVVNGYRGGNYGFFSAHASNTFSLAIFFSLLVRSRLLTFALLIWSFVNCWTRMYLGVHFPGDILVGLLWGAFAGSFVYCLFRWISQKLHIQSSTGNYISTQYTSSGFQRQDVDIVIAVLVFTYIYVLNRACFALFLD